MGGWNIYYGLLNFAILAGALVFIGRKIVVKAIKAHQDKVQSDLKQSAESLENAKKLLDGIGQEKTVALFGTDEGGCLSACQPLPFAAPLVVNGTMIRCVKIPSGTLPIISPPTRERIWSRRPAASDAA